MASKDLLDHMLSVGIPEDIQKSIGEFFFEKAHANGDNTSQIHFKKTEEEFSYRSYANIHNDAIKLAIALTKENLLKKDDYVMILARNHSCVIVAILATFYIGAKVCFLPPSFSNMKVSTPDIKEYVVGFRPKVFFVESKTFITNHGKSLIDEENPMVLIKMGSKFNVYNKNINLLSRELNAKEIAKFAPAAVDPTTVATIFHTRGISGQPKPVMVTHCDLLRQMNVVEKIEGIDPQCGLYMNPLSCVDSFVWLLLAFKTGGSRVLCQTLNSDKFFELITSLGISHADTGDLNLDQFDDIEALKVVPNLKSIHVGRGRVTRHQMELIRILLPGVDIFHSYSLTEGLGIVTMIRYKHDVPLPFNQIFPTGAALIGVTLKILPLPNTSPTSSQIKIGQIAVSAPDRKTTYHPNSQLIFINLPNNFFKTNDVGYIDTRGFLHVFNCEHEIINVDDKLVLPGQLESILERQNSVTRAVVVPLNKKKNKDKRLHLGVCLVRPITCEDYDADIIEQVKHDYKVYYAFNHLMVLSIKCMEHLPRAPEGWICRQELTHVFD